MPPPLIYYLNRNESPDISIMAIRNKNDTPSSFFVLYYDIVVIKIDVTNHV